MHRIVWYKFGEQRLHLLKLAGAFFILASTFKAFEAASNIFVTANKIFAVRMDPSLAPQLFGWSIGATSGAPGIFLWEDALGVLWGPTASFFFWLGAAVLAIMLYQTGKVVFPVEEWDAAAPAEHRKKLLTHIASHRHRIAAKKKR